MPLGQNLDDDEATEHQFDDYLVETDPNRQNEDLKKQVAHLQNALTVMAARLDTTQKHETSSKDAEESWSHFRNTQSSQQDGSVQNLRWDQMKPFPKNVAANRMWEEWRKYIENFEIAASLSNTTNPVRRTQLLFLSMGEELQGIVRAAKLRPNLNDENCYNVFIKNIEGHLRSMTDTAAEHEAFLAMYQEKGETVAAFYARLMEKALVCRYSPDNRDLFVRAQLLKGMTNRELARAARTYEHKTDFIVQSATRDEAYQVEAARASRDESVNQVRGLIPLKRRIGSDLARNTPVKKFHNDRHQSSSRRDRCSRCNRWAHRNRSCPALKQKCNECGRFGHYAVVCRRNRVNVVGDYNVFQDTKSETKEEVK